MARDTKVLGRLRAELKLRAQTPYALCRRLGIPLKDVERLATAHRLPTLPPAPPRQLDDRYYCEALDKFREFCLGRGLNFRSELMAAANTHRRKLAARRT